VSFPTTGDYARDIYTQPMDDIFRAHQVVGVHDGLRAGAGASKKVHY